MEPIKPGIYCTGDCFVTVSHDIMEAATVVTHDYEQFLIEDHAFIVAPHAGAILARAQRWLDDRHPTPPNPNE